jgi:hypothetical protein
VRTLEHVLWIGGPPGGGKSSVACRLARCHGLRWYSADTRTWQHRDRALRTGDEAALRWERMTPEERWERSTPEEMLAMTLHRERGQMAIDDLSVLPTSPLVVAEGSILPAAAVTSGTALRARAVWLMPTPRFQERALSARGTAPGPRALYAVLSATIAREAAEHDVRTVTVDGTRSLEETVGVLEQVFADALAAGPRADSRVERRVLLREANQALAGQVRNHHARPWAAGNAEAVVVDFLCECADPACVDVVPLPVGALASDDVLAPGHHS